MKGKKKPPVRVKTPENLAIYNPDEPLYEKQYLCVYMRELLDEAEKTSEDLNRKQ